MKVYFRAGCTVGNEGLVDSECCLIVLLAPSCLDEQDKEFRTQHKPALWAGGVRLLNWKAVCTDLL